MIQPIYMLILIILMVIIGGVVFQAWRHKKKVRRFLRDGFGKAPTKGYTDKLESISEYWKACAKQLPEYRAVDDITWNDLELDLIFDALNTTYSSVGSEVLYSRLHRIDSPDLEELIQAIKADEELRIDIAYYLHGLAKNDYNHASDFLFDPSSQKMAGFKPWQGLLPLVGLAVMPFSFGAGLILTMFSLAFNQWTRSRVNLRVEHGIDAVRYIANAIHFGGKLANVTETDLPEYADQLRQIIAPLKKIPSRLPVRMDPNNPLSGLLMYFNYAILLDFYQYNHALSVLIKHPEAMHQLWEKIGDAEIALVIASMDQRLPTVKPRFHEQHSIMAEDIVHPLIENAVPNPVDFSRSTLVSGSNASGKSTYVKAIAISAITAQNLGRSFAKSFSLHRGRVFTSMAIRDNIYQGDSYFVAEIKSLKRMIDASLEGKPIYLFIDEILKGTNTIERIASSHAMLNFFHQQKVPVIAATHDIELTELQADDMTNIHFREQVSQKEITFDYQIKPGATQTTNAINLLKYYDFPSNLTDQASQMARDFKQTRSWSRQ